jgi:hypothetical protein
VIEGGSDGRYAPTGHIVYAVGGTLRAIPFDVNRLAVTGGGAPVVESAATPTTPRSPHTRIAGWTQPTRRSRAPPTRRSSARAATI